MKNRIFRWCQLIFIPGMLVCGFGCQSQPPVAVRQAGLPEDKVDARAIFAESCVKCHGTDGRAKTFRGSFLDAQNFTDEKWQTTSTDPEIAKAIKKGSKSMPAFEKRLSPAEIDALVVYVRTFKPAP